MTDAHLEGFRRLFRRRCHRRGHAWGPVDPIWAPGNREGRECRRCGMIEVWTLRDDVGTMSDEQLGAAIQRASTDETDDSALLDEGRRRGWFQ